MEHKLHFIGIGGIGMSAIAKILLHEGFSISGSDVKASRLTEELAAAGARISYGHAAGNLPTDCQAVAFSSAVKEDNPEMVEARRRGIKIYRRAEMLAFLMSERISIGVAGAHGKTTTSAMLSVMLEVEGLDPTVVVGGMIPSFGGCNAKAGDGLYLVAEADESDGTFLLLRPKIAVVTNVEADHLDHYQDQDDYAAAFAQYLGQIPADGFSVLCFDCPTCRQLAAEVPGRYITYAITHEEADYTVKNIIHPPQKYGGGVLADVYYKGLLLGRLQLRVTGSHNIANALAAIAVGRELGLSFLQCAEGLLRFTGTGRRFEELGSFGKLHVVDDYAHHPTEVRTTIHSAREQGIKKLFAVFQPHRYSRTQSMYRDFAAALCDADSVLLVELYPAFEQPIAGVSARMVVQALEEMGHKRVFFAETIDEGLHMLEKEIRDEELLLIMGAGNVRSLGERYVAQRKER